MERKVPDSIWNYEVESGHAVDGQMSEKDTEILLRVIQGWLDMRLHDVSNLGRHQREHLHMREVGWMEPEKGGEEDLHRKVFAECVARAADRYPDVDAFREEVLGDRPFPLTYDEAL
ncbi:MAG: hypothetical protein M3P49_03755, partial [Actinomycetota bacterium]|nr:hypothetical protein [Actinomycetota bacterium]